MLAKERRVITSIRDLDPESKHRAILYLKKRVQSGQLVNLVIEVLEMMMD